MEFGRIEVGDLDKVDFHLPPEPEANKLILKSGADGTPAVYVGCAKWGRAEWVGRIYPPRTREKDFLRNYVLHYNAVEVNATHYKIFGEKATRAWAEKAKDRNFKFCPKMFQGITHRGKLTDKRFLTNEFLRGIAGFGQALGPVLIQVSDSFSPKRKKELFDFLSSLPSTFDYVAEVRHAGWFATAKERDELFSFLTNHNIGAVITDTAGRRDCAHMRLTVPKAFIRYVGNSLHATDYSRIDEWVARIAHWLRHGIRQVCFFMHMHDESTSPDLTVYLVDKLNDACNLDLIKPTFLVEPGSPPGPPRMDERLFKTKRKP